MARGTLHRAPALGQSSGHPAWDGGLYTSLNLNVRGPEEDTSEAPPAPRSWPVEARLPVLETTDRWHRPRPVWASQRGWGQEGRNGPASAPSHGREQAATIVSHCRPEQGGPHRAPRGGLPAVHHWGAALARPALPSTVTLWLCLGRPPVWVGDTGAWGNTAGLSAAHTSPLPGPVHPASWCSPLTTSAASPTFSPPSACDPPAPGPPGSPA